MLNVVVLTTGPLLTLDEAKAHLHVDFDDEDTLITGMINAAVRSCMTYVGRDYVPPGAEPEFKQAALLALGGFYATRESVTTGQPYQVNPMFAGLIGSHRVFYA